jgi:hypothetical protein
LLFRLGPLWNKLERRWKLAWTIVSLAVLAVELVAVVLAFTEFALAISLLALCVWARTTSQFRGFRYMARLVHLLNPRLQGAPIHDEGYQPSSAFALYLREFRAERNQQLNALNARWGIDPYERRIGQALKKRMLNLLGLVDPARPEPPQFIQEAVAVRAGRWETEVQRLVPQAAVIIVDLRQESGSSGSPITTSVEAELTIIRDEGADRRTIGLGNRSFMPEPRIWHLQPETLTGLNIALGLIVGVAAYVVSLAAAAWAIGYTAGRLHLASGVILMAWRHRFRSLLAHALASAR